MPCGLARAKGIEVGWGHLFCGYPGIWRCYPETSYGSKPIACAPRRSARGSSGYRRGIGPAAALAFRGSGVCEGGSSPGAAAWHAGGDFRSRQDGGSDIRDCDQLWLLHRPNLEEGKSVAHLYVSKQREGPIRRVRLTWDGRLTRFLANEAEREEPPFGNEEPPLGEDR